ncbi:hypothetical protein GACE_2133 [Geoglobus acetivorans]|uniref:Uncharacterized protein n=1 Tax=Geoglobus acetivorans TaxID=565033 RepID=A0A0A7GGF6_GEOAI|nr:hypothetical protein GACE_2133 [Geoglobus acetivorans]
MCGITSFLYEWECFGIPKIGIEDLRDFDVYATEGKGDGGDKGVCRKDEFLKAQ